MEPAAIDSLLSAGPLGAIIVALGVAYWRQARTLKDTQDARVTDAQKVASTLLEQNQKWNDTIGGLTAAVRELKTAYEATTRR